MDTDELLSLEKGSDPGSCCPVIPPGALSFAGVAHEFLRAFPFARLVLPFLNDLSFKNKGDPGSPAFHFQRTPGWAPGTGIRIY